MARTMQIEKRRSLARKAVKVMQREGLDISNTRLAETLDLKRPTFLYYFPTRVTLIEMAFEDLLSEQIAFVVTEMMKHTHPIDRLYA